MVKLYFSGEKPVIAELSRDEKVFAVLNKGQIFYIITSQRIMGGISNVYVALKEEKLMNPLEKAKIHHVSRIGGGTTITYSLDNVTYHLSLSGKGDPTLRYPRPSNDNKEETVISLEDIAYSA